MLIIIMRNKRNLVARLQQNYEFLPIKGYSYNENLVKFYITPDIGRVKVSL